MSNTDLITLFDGLTLNLARGCVSRSGEDIHLRPQTYEVLRYLVENRGHLISKDRLIEEVWKGRAVTDGSLGKCIEELREAFGPEAKRLIRNVRGRGYIFDANVTDPEHVLLQTSEQVDLVRVTVEEHEEIADAALRSALQTSASIWIGRSILVGLGILVVVISFIGYRAYSSRAANGAQIKSIAVLPFENQTGDPTMEYLADGLSESLINKLSQLPDVKVIARSSAFRYKGKEVNAQQVATDLGVHAILIGQLKQRGEDLLVSVELVDTRDRTQVWGDQYSRKSTDIQALQDEIARVIAKKLNSRSEERQLTQHGTQDSQAYQFYLNGLFHFRKGGLDNTKKAIDYFNQAVALDSSFALAWVAIADSNLYFAGNSLLDPKEARGKAKLALQKALELDDGLPEAHVTLAIIHEQEWDWSGAEREYKRALELNPNSVRAHSRYAYFLSSMERHTEAMAEIKRAQEIDPLDIGLKSREAWSLTLAGRHEESIEKYQQILNIDPDLRTSTGLGFAYENKALYAQAAEEFRKQIELKGETTSGLIYLGYDLAMSGRKGEAQAILARLKETKDYVSPEELAGLYAGLGDKEGALAMLERAYQEHDLQLQVLKIDRRLDSLRSDARFQDLLRRVGLAL